MPVSKQRPLEAVAGDSVHDFSQPVQNWECTVFDKASYFSVVQMRGDTHAAGVFGRGDQTHTLFTVFPWAIRFARSRTDACLYAVSASGRFALIDREKWSEWEQRWRAAKMLPDAARAQAEKPNRGTITEWVQVSAPQGLGYAIDGRMGGRKVMTTSVLRREGNEVETLSWRYTLGETS